MFHALCTSVMKSSRCILEIMENDVTVADEIRDFIEFRDNSEAHMVFGLTQVWDRKMENISAPSWRNRGVFSSKVLMKLK